MNTSPLFLAVRAISSEFARRIYLPLVLTVDGILFAVLVATIWLTIAVSPWWWLLLIPVIVLSLVFIFVSALIGVAIHMLRPTQTKDQRKAVASLVDKLQEVSEVLQTPKFLLLFRLAKDTLLPSKEGFIGKMTSHATTLKPDFQNIIASFKQ